MVIEDLSEACVIGAYTMQKFRIKLDCENEKVVLDPRVQKIRI
jgi:hypothetical protein